VNYNVHSHVEICVLLLVNEVMKIQIYGGATAQTSDHAYPAVGVIATCY